jgi:hypothetical protein
MTCRFVPLRRHNVYSVGDSSGSKILHVLHSTLLQSNFSRSPSNPVYVRRVDFSDLVFSLSSHRHSCIGLELALAFLIHNKQFCTFKVSNSRAFVKTKSQISFVSLILIICLFKSMLNDLLGHFVIVYCLSLSLSWSLSLSRSLSLLH